MTVEKIVNPQPVVLNADETIAQAIASMIQHRVRSFPVVDDDGRFVGMFGLRRVLGMLLPRVVTMDDDEAMDLSFISDTREHLREKLAEIGDARVRDFLDKDALAVHPDTHLVEAVLLLYRGGANLPVVDKATGKLLGLVSPWEVLNHVA